MVELLRSLRERGAIQAHGDKWHLEQSQHALADMPQSMRSMIELKIGALEEGNRQLLSAASVLGSEFESAAVARTVNTSQMEVEDRLDILSRVHGLVRSDRESTLPDGSISVRYRFVHVLYQNTFYGSLSPSRRIALSLAAANALVSASGDEVDPNSLELALLYESARDFSKAADYFLRASERARQVFADRQAAQLARRGLEMVRLLPDSPERASRELTFLVRLVTLPIQSEFSAVASLIERASSLSASSQKPEQVVPILVARMANHFMRSEFHDVDAVCDELALLAKESANELAFIYTRYGYGAALVNRGQTLSKARQLLEEGAARGEQCRHRDAILTTGFNPVIGCHYEIARILWLMGFPDQAVSRSQTALRLARQTGHPLMLMFAAFFVAFV